MRKNINILNRERCTGCRVCENVCPSQAIEFKENKEGFLYPNVKEDLCTNCGFCTQKCPVLTETEYGEIQECYAVMSEKDIRMESSSGGMFTVLANYILKKADMYAGLLGNLLLRLHIKLFIEMKTYTNCNYQNTYKAI